MSSNAYIFITQWRVEATLDEVVATLSDATQLPRWWPSVYLDVRELAPGNATGVGKRVALHTKGWLPYSLRWQFVVTEVSRTGFALCAEGDFVGRGVWTFKPDGAFVEITYDWRIDANKPLLRYLSFVMKPVFARNHAWAMRQGEISLKRELLRRRSISAGRV
jgi:hypothetical protein